MANNLPFDLVCQIVDHAVQPRGELGTRSRLNSTIHSNLWRGFLAAPNSDDKGYGLHQHWQVQLDSSDLQRALKCVRGGDGLTGDKQTGLCDSIRSLELEPSWKLQTFTRVHDFDDAEDNEECMASYKDRVYHRSQGGRRGVQYDGRVHYDTQEEHGLLRELFDTLKNIECFQAGVPEVCSVYDGGWKHRADCYDIEGLDDLISTLQYGLRSPAFTDLVDLRLALPSTWHLASLAEVLPQTTRARLKHLGLQIVDKSGPGGDIWYGFGDNGEHEHPDGELTEIWESGFPPSNVQYAHPDRDHVDKLWAFVVSCDNLETFALEATHYLQVDQLKWSPGPKSKGLRNLLLKRVWTDVDSIFRLLRTSPTSDGPSAIRKLILEDVKMYENGGNWDTVFAHIETQCPDLEFLDLYELTYWSTHPRYCGNGRPGENSNTIWTDEDMDEDHTALAKLVKHHLEKTGGREHYPRHLGHFDPVGYIEEWEENQEWERNQGQ